MVSGGLVKRETAGGGKPWKMFSWKCDARRPLGVVDFPWSNGLLYTEKVRRYALETFRYH